MHPSCFNSECHVDTLLIKTIFNGNEPIHQHGINSVISNFYKITNRSKNTKILRDEFVVGIIDNDLNWNNFKDNFHLIANYNNEFYVYQRSKEYNHHYLIFIHPAVEKFILNAVATANINTNDYNIPDELEQLKRITKHPNRWTSEIRTSFVHLFQNLFYQNHNAVSVLRRCILYFRDTNYNVDIDELNNLINN